MTYFHPEHTSCSLDWDKWRLAYEGGSNFIAQYLEKLSGRESDEDYLRRKKLTYCPAFAKAGVNEIRDSIYNRMSDILRIGGSTTYQEAVSGLNGGVDLEGSNLNYFMGMKVLPELLIMGKVGIYVDMPSDFGESLMDAKRVRPYIYIYRREDILNWVKEPKNDSNGLFEYSSIYLREIHYTYDDETGMPKGQETRYRRMWKDANGEVNVVFVNEKDEQVDQNGLPLTSPIILGLKDIPFLTLEIDQSMMADVADYQVALLNLASTDITYAVSSNVPFYTEQYDGRITSAHIRPADTADTADTAKTTEIKVGASRGRRYPKGFDRPDFIHPSSEPLKVSMEKQEQLKAEIRQLLKLSLNSLRGPAMASADSKKADSKGLESGLSYIGLTLESGERKLSAFWSMYEGTSQAATVYYPETYDLKTDQDRIEEALSLDKIMTKIPSASFQKEIAKRIAKVMLGAKIRRDELQRIMTEIDKAPAMTSDPEVVAKDVEAGLLGLELASKIRGYPDGEVEKAKKDHAERLARIAEAQGRQDTVNPASRGNPDASGDPKHDAKAEKQESKDTTNDDVVKRKVRGEGQ